jgi:hypothetical protein
LLGVSKNPLFLRWFQKGAGTPELSNRDKNFTRKTEFWGKIFGHFLTQELCTFLKSAGKLRFFRYPCGQFQRIIFLTLKGAVLHVLEDKRQNNITIQYLKNMPL